MDKNLAAFLAVTRCKTLTGASDFLGLTQPSVTKRIANLEAEMGAALFHRGRRGMTLTAAGQVYFRRAERIETEYRQCREEVATINEAGLSVMRVGAGPLFHLNWAAGLFLSLKAQFPELKLELRTDRNLDVGRMLSEGELDVYLGIIPRQQLDESIFVEYLISVEHGIILRADDPIAAKQTIDPSELTEYSWVSFLADPETESRLLKYSVPKGAAESLVEIRTTSFAAGLQLVKTGQFVMSAPLQLAGKIGQEGLVIRPARGRMPHREAGIHVRHSALGYRSVQAVLEFFDKLDLEQSA